MSGHIAPSPVGCGLAMGEWGLGRRGTGGRVSRDTPALIFPGADWNVDLGQPVHVPGDYV